MNKNVGIAVAILAVLGLGIWAFAGMSDDDMTNESTTTEQTTTNETTEQVEQSNIVELAQATPTLSTLVSAVVGADLVETLADENAEFTVFAPTDEAFATLLEELDITAEELLAREDLSDILTFHVVAGEAFAADLVDGQELTTVNGETLTVAIDDGIVTVGGAEVVLADVDASNGVVHVIDTVLLPSS